MSQSLRCGLFPWDLCEIQIESNISWAHAKPPAKNCKRDKSTTYVEHKFVNFDWNVSPKKKTVPPVRANSHKSKKQKPTHKLILILHFMRENDLIYLFIGFGTHFGSWMEEYYHGNVSHCIITNTTICTALEAIERERKTKNTSKRQIQRLHPQKKR